MSSATVTYESYLERMYKVRVMWTPAFWSPVQGQLVTQEVEKPAPDPKPNGDKPVYDDMVQYLINNIGVPESNARRVAASAGHAYMLPHSYVLVDEQPTEEITFLTSVGYKKEKRPRHDNPIYVRRCSGCGLCYDEVEDFNGAAIPCVDFQLRADPTSE